MAEDTLPTAQSQDGSSSEPSPFVIPQISLPKGGGAIRGIGEKFTANTATGTGSLAVPIALTPGRGGFGPQLSVSYNSGSGNGPLGIGWSFSLPSIQRKTDKGLPRYRDAVESDVFVLSGAEDLVPVMGVCEAGHGVEGEFEREGFRVKRYRPRIEGLFSIIERWTRIDDRDTHWRSLSKDNILTVYGRTRESRVFDPHDDRHVFSWLICESYDDKGNAIVYEYVPENDDGVDFTRANERDRVRGPNRYLKRIRYGNRQPILLDPNLPSFRRSHISVPEITTAQWMFEAVLDYGDGHYSQDPPDCDGWTRVQATPISSSESQWPARKDPFSSYRSGFEVRTYRLCRRVLMFHHFPDELGADDSLIRSTEFEYHEKPLGSFITRIIQSGYTHHSDGAYRKKSLPALELTYTSSPLENPNYAGHDVKEADPENLPEGIDGANYRWLDLDGEGISGVLTEQGETWFYKANAGCGRFRPMQLVAHRPSLAALREGRQHLLDLSGDGQLDLVQLGYPTPGFFERKSEGAWGQFRPFRSMPVLNWDDPNLRLVDITGDGIADVLITEDDAFTWYGSLLDQGFDEAERVPVPHNERKGPHVVFADGTQSLYLADMSGDGLSDLVRIRNGEICYWPNLGYGKFGRKVTMDNAPWFADPDLFDKKRIRLADTDGSGTTDIVYLDRDGIKVFLNQAGNGWSEPRVLHHFATNDQTSVSVVDFLGRGTACLLWSSTLPRDARHPLRYVDLMAGEKPHLLTRIRNNLGAETRIEYASSTEFYLADKAAGTPWVTRLPFPVHVVKRVETYDWVSRNRFTQTYSYHHGYFDGVEREFRGFGRVDTLDTETITALSHSKTFPHGDNIKPESNVPPVLTKTWFHTGVYLNSGRISRHMEHEYWQEPGLSDEEQTSILLADTMLPEELTAEEAREACRALKGSILRQEIYALDGIEESHRPYTVSESNFAVRLVQARGTNLHAVFFKRARESLSLNYERKLYDFDGHRRADPRVGHTVTLEVDEYGNVLTSVSIGYGRRFKDSGLSAQDHDNQERILLTLTDNDYTNAVRGHDAYRTPLPSDVRTYELIHVRPKAHRSATTNLFRLQELERVVERASDGRHDLPYEDISGTGAARGIPYRRLIAQSRTLYRSDDLSHLLPIGHLEALALPGEFYTLAFEPGLISQVYRRHDPSGHTENLLPDPSSVLGDEGGYVDLDGDGRWWIPSGRQFFSPNSADNPTDELAYARSHFFVTRRFRDPFGNTSSIVWDPQSLLLVESRDPIGNTVRAQNDYRFLAPKLVTNANGNRFAAAFDALGTLAGTALMGKEGQTLGDSLEGFVADLSEPVILAHMKHPFDNPQAILGNSTTRFLYDLFAFVRTQYEDQPQPAVIYMLARETHVSALVPDQQIKVQHSFTYSDGFGRVIQKKAQAEPGPIREGAPAIDPRWIGTGWTIFNNKGKAVRQYEPFFSDTQSFEFGSIIGVSPTVFYDPLGRVLATLHPEHTFEKVVFDPWKRVTWDVNDTVLEADPAEDPDVGPYFARLPKDDYLPTLYVQCRNGGLGREAKDAAEKAAVHARTPQIAHFDTLGRPFLTIDQNRLERSGAVFEERFFTRLALDVQGQQREITDACGRHIASYDYSIAGTRIHTLSTDAGERWILQEVTKRPLRSWDGRGFRYRYEYDTLRRQTYFFVQHQREHEILAERIVYGESASNSEALNLRGQIYKHFDSAGVATNSAFDFKSNLVSSSRQLLRHYREITDWSRSPELEDRYFTSVTTYDALNRAVTITTPDSTVIRPGYNTSSLLRQLNVNLRGSDMVTAFVTDINYNARGQRESINFGNRARTGYVYDENTFRLIRLETTRANAPSRLQDLNYTFDPIGNITSISDHAQQREYFNNQAVRASNGYVYDAVYRLIRATGREHIGLLTNSETTSADMPRMNQPLPEDGRAMRRYTEDFTYDSVGNILELVHHAADQSWRRKYQYGDLDNRLRMTIAGQYEEHYDYDANGNTTQMPHLPQMEWDFKNQLHMTQRQVVNDGPGERTYYVYDSAGQRIRKITETASGTKKSERIYVGGFELYREYKNDDLVLERETLHIMDDKRRVAVVETKTVDKQDGVSNSPEVLIRYQFSNHLNSACLELDEEAAIISYEEYYAYGNTSYEAVRSWREVPPKRYRFIGQERDEQTGLYHFGARYYASWLGRWISTDPKGLLDNTNLFAYCSDNPVRLHDPNGGQPEMTPAEEQAQACLIDPSVAASTDQQANYSSNTVSEGQGAIGVTVGATVVRYNPPGFTLEVPNNFDADKIAAYKERITDPFDRGVGIRSRPPGARSATADIRAANQGLRDAFEAGLEAGPNNPAGMRPPGTDIDHTVELQHIIRGNDAPGADVVRPEDFRVQSSSLNRSQGASGRAVNARQVANGAPVDTPAGGVARTQDMGKFTNQPEFRTGMRAGGYALAAAGTIYSAYSFSQDVSEGNWTGAALDGTGFAGGALVLGGSAAGSTTLVAAGTVVAAPAAVIGAGIAGWQIGTYINNHTGISDTAQAGGEWVEAHTGSTILGATAAAGTAIITSPYYAGQAAVGALEDAGSWIGGKVYDWLH